MLMMTKVEVMSILSTMIQVRPRREESCLSRTSRVKDSSSALPGSSEGEKALMFDFTQKLALDACFGLYFT